jgi:hypothetical protein
LGQCALILITAGLSVFIVGCILKSYQLSLFLLIDPGAFTTLDTNADSTQKLIISIMQVIIGIILVGGIVSVLTNQLLGFSEKNRLREEYDILKEAFETQSIRIVKNFLKKNGIKARLKNLNIENAEARLEIGKEDIIKAIRTFGNLRIRHIRTTKEVVIEDFEANTVYGSFIDKQSPITIIAAQNYSDANIGHFSATLANTLDCNYISNEFFSTGAPLKERHINFGINPAFNDFQVNGNTPLDQFIEDIKKIDVQTKLYLYINSGSDTRTNDLHLLFRGDSEQAFQSQNSTYSNLDFLRIVYEELQLEFERLGYKAGTHEELSFKDPESLSNALHNYFHKDVLVFCISTKILWTQDEKKYYEAMLAIISAIKKLASN